MNRMSWLGLTLLLAVGAVLGTSAMRRLSQPLPPFEAPQDAGAEAGGGKSARGGGTSQGSAEEARRLTQSQAGLAVNAVTMDLVWEKSLFHPDRTEKTAGSDEAPAAEEAPPSEFELVGIARIGDAEKAQAVAIIKHELPVSRNARLAAARARTLRARTQGGAPPAAAPAAEPPEETKKKQKKIFRVGDEINETGYVIKAIDATNNTVTLNKGSEEVTLKIDLTDKKTSTRRQEVVNQELAVRDKNKAAEAAAAAAAAPAAAAGGAGGAGGAGAVAGAAGASGRPQSTTIGGRAPGVAPGGAAGAAGAAGAGGMPPGPPSRFPSRGVRTNPNAPQSAVSAEGGQGSPDTTNPFVNRMRYSNRPRPGQQTQQSQ